MLAERDDAVRGTAGRYHALPWGHRVRALTGTQDALFPRAVTPFLGFGHSLIVKGRKGRVRRAIQKADAVVTITAKLFWELTVSAMRLVPGRRVPNELL